MVPSFIKGLTLIHALVIAVVAFVVAQLFVRTGILNTILWIVAVGALIVGVVNTLSYGG